jgi:co-chaperonin GroES (HSP10)
MIKSVYEDRILIKVVDPSQEEGDYLMPEGYDQEEEQLAGLVTHIGVEVKETVVGDVVVFGAFDYSTIIIEGVKHILTKEDNLICKLKANEQEDSKGE